MTNISGHVLFKLKPRGGQEVSVAQDFDSLVIADGLITITAGGIEAQRMLDEVSGITIWPPRVQPEAGA